MYKIYINENALILTDSQTIKDQKYASGALIAPYGGKSKMLLSYIDMMEKSQRFKEIVIHSNDYMKLKADFVGLYHVVNAAGGLVINENGEGLFIHRRGFWDLPKGKLDKGEKKKSAALREVEEETGVCNLELKKKLITTRHTYKTKSNRRAIKKTKWFLMEAPFQALTPQLEEDIIKAEWLALDKNLLPMDEMYKNIKEVLMAYWNSPFFKV